MPDDDPSTAKTAALIASNQRPPPERPEDVRRRRFVILSFWAIVVLLGLPIWRWTTSIYRARLPLQEMMEWADGKVSPNCRCLPVYGWLSMGHDMEDSLSQLKEHG